ncbi:MAG: type I DNA topoisomerase [Chloroflexi bacterium]|nr:type I DNA topoisomerase [Chloroflexota bacterium]
MQNAQPLFSAKGTAYSQGTCNVCGTKLTRFGKTDAHAAVARLQTTDDRPSEAQAKSKKPKVKSGKSATRNSQSEIRNPKPLHRPQGQVSEIGNLVIVESPAKAKTISRFLGAGYRVRASVGHIRDLPERQMGVDIENDFRPHYVIAPKKKDVVKELKADAQNASAIFLATDPDREGEAISWHLLAALDSSIRGKPVQRVEFHEITRDAIERAFASPREINQQLVDAQQARRVLDRLVGYTISPLLRKKVNTKNLSAGRVQSVAVRLVVEREREIGAFVAVEYWSIEAELQKRAEWQVAGDGKATPTSNFQSPTSKPFRAKLIKVGEKDFECHAGDDALKLKEILEHCAYVVLDVRKKDVFRNPPAPFITSTLQQEASRKLGFNAKRTMANAQQLYEGLAIGAEGSVGLITYMRTDSTNVAAAAQSEAAAYIKEKFGDAFLTKSPRAFKKIAGAQEAHEAIRPTSVLREPAKVKPFLNADQFKLYELIWKRFVASQMASAIFDTTAVDIGAWKQGRAEAGETNHPITQSPNYLFRANGSVIKFRGFLAVYIEGKEDEEKEEDVKELPPLARTEPLDLLGIFPEQHFTQPPPRFTEASLIKALEEHGIGRPSTYAPILSTIQDRGYVERMPDRKLKPTELGFIVNDLLVKHFAHEVDLKFTAQMEEKLDRIAEGQADWVQTLRDFYTPFKQTLDRAAEEMPTVALPVETTDVKCDVCGSPMVIKRGKFGKFLACSTFPKCKGTQNLSARGGSAKTGVTCPECKQGQIVERRSKKGRVFFSCNRYPECKFALWDKPIQTPCPKCGGVLTENKKGVKCVNGDYAGEVFESIGRS